MSRNLSIAMLPGLDGTGELYAPLLEALPSHLEPLVVRYPPDPHLGLGELTAHALRTFGSLQPDIILGESFSGPIAFRLAAAPREKPPLLLLCASFLDTPRAGMLRLCSIVLPFISSVSPPRIAVRALCVGNDASDELVETVRSTIRSVPPPVLRARLELLRTLRLPSEPLHIRSAYLLPTRDRLVSRAHVDAVSASLPGLRIVPIAGPHFLLQAKPRACAAAIDELADELC